MFFRRAITKKLSFEDHLSNARKAGFQTTTAPAGTRVERQGVACVMKAGEGDIPVVTERAGVIMGQEIGGLTDGGYQKFFLSPLGRRKPAQAEDLKAIHNFQEDLREALGLTSLYNESLGTVSNKYLYDRVEGRDQAPHHKPWDSAA